MPAEITERKLRGREICLFSQSSRSWDTLALPSLFIWASDSLPAAASRRMRPFRVDLGRGRLLEPTKLSQSPWESAGGGIAPKFSWHHLQVVAAHQFLVTRARKAATPRLFLNRVRDETKRTNGTIARPSHSNRVVVPPKEPAWIGNIDLSTR